MSLTPAWQTFRQVGSQHRFKREYASAIESFKQAIAAASAEPEAVGEIVVMYNAVADLYVQMGDKPSAIDYLRRGIDFGRRRLPCSDILIGNNLVYLAALLKETGANEEANTVAQEGLLIFANTFGPAHPETARMRDLLAQVDPTAC